MIKIAIGFQENRFYELSVHGHASGGSGKSLTCNSVSILTQNFEESLLQLVDRNAFRIENTSGKSEILRNGNYLGAEQDLILDCLVKSYVIGIRRVQLSFPKEVVLDLRDTKIV